MPFMPWHACSLTLYGEDDHLQLKKYLTSLGYLGVPRPLTGSCETITTHLNRHRFKPGTATIGIRPSNSFIHHPRISVKRRINETNRSLPCLCSLLIDQSHNSRPDRGTNLRPITAILRSIDEAGQGKSVGRYVRHPSTGFVVDAVVLADV